MTGTTPPSAPARPPGAQSNVQPQLLARPRPPPARSARPAGPASGNRAISTAGRGSTAAGDGVSASSAMLTAASLPTL